VGLPERLAAVVELRRLNASADDVENVSRRLVEEWEVSQQLDAVDPPYQAVLLCVYTLTALFSITGNFVVIIVLTFGKRYARPHFPLHNSVFTHERSQLID